MFIKSEINPELEELSPESLVQFNQYLMLSDDDVQRRQFILNALLAGSLFDPNIAHMILFTIGSALSVGVDTTINILNNEFDAATGPDRVEEALASGLL